MSTRRGACPTLHEPMATGDGLLVRLSPANKGWTPCELSALAKATARFGSGVVEVTARGNLQIRGLTAESAAELATHVEEAAISIGSGLPIDTGPLAGIDAQEIADPLPLANELRTAIEAAGHADRLGPKVSVVIDGGGALTLDGVIADVRLKADEAIPGHWRIAVDGTARRGRHVGFVAETFAVPAVIALLEAIAAKDKMARGRDLTDGDLAALSGVPPLRFAARTSPPEGDRGSATAIAASLSFPPASGGEVSRRSRDGVGVDTAARVTIPVGRYPLRDARLAVGFALPFGQADADTLIAFCTAVGDSGASEIRLAPGRGLVVPGLEAEACRALEARATALGFIADPADPRLSIVACAGAPFCTSAHFPTRALGAEIAQRAPELVAGRTLHLSGCAKRCAEALAPSFTILGTPGGCQVLPGDGRDAPPASAVAPDEALAALRQLINSELKHENRPAHALQPAETWTGTS